MPKKKLDKNNEYLAFIAKTIKDIKPEEARIDIALIFAQALYADVKDFSGGAEGDFDYFMQACAGRYKYKV